MNSYFCQQYMLKICLTLNTDESFVIYYGTFFIKYFSPVSLSAAVGDTHQQSYYASRHGTIKRVPSFNTKLLCAPNRIAPFDAAAFDKPAAISPSPSFTSRNPSTAPEHLVDNTAKSVNGSIERLECQVRSADYDSAPCTINSL